jgi:hypothetical protein
VNWNTVGILQAGTKELPPYAIVEEQTATPYPTRNTINVIGPQPIPAWDLTRISTVSVGTPGATMVAANYWLAGTIMWTMWTGTQAQYDAIVTKDPNTLYCVTP